MDANVTKSYYEKGAPEGWKVNYDFEAINPITNEQEVYWGWSQGPKLYYADLCYGDMVTIIYDPCDPRINCEIRRFLNSPSTLFQLNHWI